MSTPQAEVHKSIKEFKFSPDTNPLLDGCEIKLKRKKVRSNIKSETLINPIDGDERYVSTIHMIEDVDDAHFVKVFEAGVVAMHGLNKTASRVFHIILKEYERTPLSGGYADAVELPWINGGLLGKSVGMSEKTFKRGLLDLLTAQFIARRANDTFWVNPALFFKGSRARFIKEYRRQNQKET